MFNVVFQIDEVDYEGIVDLLTTNRITQDTEKTDSINLQDIKSRMKTFAFSAIRAGAKLVPERAKEQVALTILTQQKEALIDKANKFLSDQSIACTLKDYQVAK